VVAASAIVDEADDLVAELAVLPYAPRARASSDAQYACTYNVETTPNTTARMLPTRTAKKSSTRERPRRSRYTP